MGQAQRPRSSKRVRFGVAILLGSCSLLWIPALAGAAESSPTPEAAPPSATSTARLESPTPDVSASQSSPPAPVAPARSAPSPHEPSATEAPSSPSSGPGTARPHTRRSSSPGRKATLSKPHKAAQGHARPYHRLSGQVAAQSPDHHDATLLLLSSLALGVLALASMSLLRMLMQLGRLPHGRPAT